MSDKAEAAVACFREGFSCSQAILSIYGPEFGLARETALKAGAALGAGMGRLGEVCGAVTGAMIVIGLKYGHTEAKDKETKTKTYDRVRDYGERFRSLHGSLLCRDLLGCDLGTEEGMATARQKGCFTELCPRLVRGAAEILEDVL
ncbi:MAG: C-GCAxxG-C-C family protein [Syntrophales bacterium]|nr:C-GCAxxG-C-C family protein [Syntrophales bacterium]